MKVIGKLKGIWGIISDPYHFYHLPLNYNIMKHFEEGNGNPLQYSCLENPLDRGAPWATVHGVAESDTRLSGRHNETFAMHRKSFHTSSLEKFSMMPPVKDLNLAQLI